MEGLSAGTINLFVLPILGGYWFQYKFFGTHYRAERLTPQRLVFHAAMHAILLFVTARLLVDIAISRLQPDSFAVELWMLGVIPAFLAFALISLLLVCWVFYKNAAKAESNRTGPNGSSTRTGQAGDLSTEIARAACGVAIAGVLIWLASHIVMPMLALSSTAIEIFSASLFIALFGATGFHHHFINKYYEFAFVSIALRIALFGVIGSLALACFFFNFSLLQNSWNEWIHVHGSGIPVLALTLGLVLWWPLNLLYPYQAANTRLHEANGTTALDRLLYQASLGQHLLSISMDDGKVYIGYVQELPPNPEDRNSYFEILPIHSGYRDKDTRELKLTTFYEGVYEKLVRDGADEAEWQIFLKVLKVDCILSAGRFDPKFYVEFKNEELQRSEHETWDDPSG